MFDFEYRNLAHVPRWVIASTIKTQSVAEHTFFVVLYTYQLAKWLGMDVEDRFHLLVMAIMHDVPEYVTGDMPGPVKRMVVDKDKLNEYEGRIYKGLDLTVNISVAEKQVIKAADLIDECFFLRGELNMGNKTVMLQLENAMSRMERAICKLVQPGPDRVRLLNAINQQLHRGTFAIPINDDDLAS